MNTKTGKIIPHGVKPEPHELDTILFFTNLGKNIELIVPSNTPHAKTPDFFMENLNWEVKSPKINQRRTIERLCYCHPRKMLQKYSQSPQIIYHYQY